MAYQIQPQAPEKVSPLTLFLPAMGGIIPGGRNRVKGEKSYKTHVKLFPVTGLEFVYTTIGIELTSNSQRLSRIIMYLLLFGLKLD